MLRALDRETYRRLSVNSWTPAREVPHTDTNTRASNSGNICEVRDLATRGSLSGRGLRLQSSVVALAFEIAWLRGERRGERRPSSAGERVGAEAHVDCHLADRQP